MTSLPTQVVNPGLDAVPGLNLTFVVTIGLLAIVLLVVFGAVKRVGQANNDQGGASVRASVNWGVAIAIILVVVALAIGGGYWLVINGALGSLTDTATVAPPGAR